MSADSTASPAPTPALTPVSIPRIQQPSYALVCVDVQNDFCTGSLAVNNSLQIIPQINQLRHTFQFDLTILTLDAHTDQHISFIDNHNKYNPSLQTYDSITLSDGTKQTLWPKHCVIGTWGYQLQQDLCVDQQHDIKVEKGTDINYEFYSAFWSTNRKKCTPLKQILEQHGITHVVVVGLAMEYCVGNTALDARKEGFETIVVEDCAAGLDAVATEQMKQSLRAAGAVVTTLSHLPSYAPELRRAIRTPTHGRCSCFTRNGFCCIDNNSSEGCSCSMISTSTVSTDSQSESRHSASFPSSPAFAPLACSSNLSSGVPMEIAIVPSSSNYTSSLNFGSAQQ